MDAPLDDQLSPRGAPIAIHSNLNLKDRPMTKCPVMTSANGSPVGDNQNSLTAGVNGGVKMYRRGGAKMSHGLGGSLSR